MSEKEFKAKYFEYNLLMQQLDQSQQELIVLQNSVNEMLAAKQTLNTVSKEKGNPEIFVPLGGNSFLKADVKDTKKVLTGVGAGVVVEKDVPDAMKTLDNQISEMKKAQEKLQNQIRELNSRVQMLEPEMQKLAEKAQKK